MEQPRIQEDPRKSIDGVLGHLRFLGNDLEYRTKDIERELAMCNGTHESYRSYLRRESAYHQEHLNAEYIKAAKMIYEVLPEQIAVSGEVYFCTEEGERESVFVDGATFLLREVNFPEIKDAETVISDPILVLSDGEGEYYAMYSTLKWREVSLEETA